MDTASTPAVKQQAVRPPPRRRPRKWLPYLGACALAAVIVWGLWPRPVAVEMGKAMVGPLRTTVNEEGKTRIRQRYIVSAPVGGQLRRIPFKAGAEIKSTETIIAVIDPVAPTMLDARSRALAEARRDTAAANLERARAAHHFASSELKRAEKLSTEKTISPQELENVQWRETATLKDLAAAESAFRQAEAELIEDAAARHTNGVARSVEIRAPTRGRVLRVFEESARVVTAGTDLLELGNPAELEVVIEVLSRDGATIIPGTPTELDQWGGREPLSARVRYVEPAAFTKVSALGVEEQRVNVVADVLTPWEKHQLGDNFRVEARIITWQTNAALKVPSGALFRRNGDATTFLIRDGRARLQRVKTGHSSGAETEIIEGLQEGEELIVYPGDRITDGARVKMLRISG